MQQLVGRLSWEVSRTAVGTPVVGEVGRTDSVPVVAVVVMLVLGQMNSPKYFAAETQDPVSIYH